MLPSLPSSTATNRILAPGMAACLGFLALAVFSPLHKHDANGRCSLNNFEHLAQGETESVAPVPEPVSSVWSEPPPANVPRGVSVQSVLTLRGPPAFL